MLKEFREFAIKGNMLDLAIGVVIGAAFGKIVDSLVADILMPPIGKLTGNLDFSAMAFKIGVGADGKDVNLNYGKFINAFVGFLIVAFALFMVVKVVNALKRKDEAEASAAPAEPSKSEIYLQEIRDLLKAK